MSIAEVKQIGWDHITLSKNGFKGAVQNYSNGNGGKVAVCFNFHEAFIVEDEQGLFAQADLVQGIIKAKDIDIESTGLIVGAYVIAWEEEGIVSFDEEKLTALGINDFSIKESITNRLKALAGLDVFVDAV